MPTYSTSPGNEQSSFSQLLSNALPARVPPMSRLVKDTKDEYMFIGDSATLSFLQNIRRIIRRSSGSCPFVDDPLRHHIVESSPETRRKWILASAQNPPPTQSPEEIEYLQSWYMQSANSVLLLFDEKEFDRNAKEWQEKGADMTDPASSVYYLVFAIGAQTGPREMDALAEKFFNYGRYLTVETLMEAPDITTVQAFALITMYLLGASRRNSAFMYLGMGVRAAYALGLHSKDVSALFPQAECRARERLWKAIRILDLFMSASLGRPPSTAETRDTTNKDNYSACNDLSMIFESILSNIYAKRMVSADVLESISRHHRRWSAQCSDGFETDGIQRDDFTGTGPGGQQPNLGLLHLKQRAYWALMLSSLPFLLKTVSTHLEDTHSTNPSYQPKQPASSSTSQVLVFACVESAFHTVDLSQVLLTTELTPKRLPFVVNSVFLSGLVLGVATFGDLYTSFPLERSLRMAQRILKHFSPHDAIAKRHSTILEHLQEACETYLETRTRRNMKRQGLLVGRLFGSVESITRESPDHMEQDIGRIQVDNCAFNGPNEIDHTMQTVLPTTGSGPGLMGGLMAPPENHEDNAERPRLDDEAEVSVFADLIPSLSPSLLWFESFDSTMPLFPTIDAHVAGISTLTGDEQMGASSC